MNDIITELNKGLEQGYTISDSINEFMRMELESAVNTLLQNELTAFLDYEKWDPAGYNTGNSRNGSYARSMDTKFGEIHIDIPRDRTGEFQQHTVPKYKRNDGSLEEMVIRLYQKGITTSEIADLVEKMYGSYYTPQTISNLTKATGKLVEQFHTRTLSRRYTVIYADATFINVRRDTVAKEALHVLIGINDAGEKEVLDYALYPSESCENYRDMLQDIRSRGVEEVLLFVSDGLKELRNVFLEEYPLSEHQSCWVHLDRAILRNVRAKDQKEVIKHVKKIYKADTIKEARTALQSFIERFGSQYPKAINVVKDNPSLFSFYSFPKEIQRSIYTTNLIESFNKGLKRDIKRKEQFPGEESLDRFVCVKVLEYNKKSLNRAMRGFKVCQYEINQLFEQRYTANY